MKLDVEIGGKKYGVDSLTDDSLGIASLGLDHLKIKYYDTKTNRYVELDVGRWVKVKYE